MYCFSKFCRFCLSNSTDLFNYNLKENNEFTYYEQIIKLVPKVQYFTSEKFPKLICTQCIAQLNALKKFKQKCLNSQKQLVMYCKQLESNGNFYNNDGIKTTLNVHCESVSNQNNLKEEQTFVPNDDDKPSTDVIIDISQFEVNNFQSQLIHSVDKSFSIDDDSRDIGTDEGDERIRPGNNESAHLNVNLIKKEIMHIVTNYSVHSEEVIKDEIDNEYNSTIEEKVHTGDSDSLHSGNDNENDMNRGEMNLIRDEINAILAKGSFRLEVITRDEINNEKDEDDVSQETTEQLNQAAGISTKTTTNTNGNNQQYNSEISSKKVNLNDGKIQKNIHDDEKPYCCGTCNKRYKALSDLKIHIRNHTGERPFPCDMCNKRFTNAKAMRKHRGLHTGCKICGKKFQTYSTLLIHERTHIGEKTHSCDICNEQFLYSSLLIIHKRFHSEDRPFSCKTCGKRFKTASNLTGHIRLHSNERPYSCKMCPKTYKNSTDLRIHERSHTGERPYMCVVCDKQFTSGRSLRRHKTMHTDERPFSCEKCGKRFKTSAHLYCHELTHTGEKPHACRVCDRRFAKSSNRDDHERIHAKVYPYFCEICNRKFKSSVSFEAHNLLHD